MELKKLTFEEWINYVFDHPVNAKQAWYFRGNRPYWNETSKPLLTVDYLIRFFSQSDSYTRTYSDAQLNQGLWFLADPSCSNHMNNLLMDSVPVEKRIACIHAIFTLYKQLFAARCSGHLSHTLFNDDPEVNPLNHVCYMWWDVLPIYAKSDDASRKHIDAACLDVMEQTLRLDSIACQESALHGLGHWHHAYPQRVETVIDAFLQRNPETPLTGYAQAAKTGCVL